MRASIRGRRLILLTTVAILALPAVAGAHLRLKRSVPANGSRVSSPPSAVRLWFTETPEVALTSVTLTPRGGSPIAHAPLRVDRENDGAVVADFGRALPSGSYLVAWRAASRDGHSIRGRFTFAVAPPPPR